jgi:transcriptional regulator GlxA family with amidase domain
LRVAFALFPQFTALDVVGPFNILAYGPEVATTFVAPTMSPVPADAGTLRIPPDEVFADVDAADVIIVPGGPGWRRIAEMSELTRWLARTAPAARFVASVCTGAFALGAAGLLDGKRATTHWATHRHLDQCGAIATEARVVVDGNVVTAAGVSAGIDMALTLAGLMWGDDVAEAIQLANEYAPDPPYTCGIPSQAPSHLVDTLRDRLDR